MSDATTLAQNSTAYAELERRFARIGKIGGAMGILSWDQQTIMPRGSNEARAEQLATLQLIAHEMMTDPAMADLLARAGDETVLDDWQGANLREMRREWVFANAIPSDLVEAMTMATSTCEMAWRDARANSDFQALLPHLEKLLTLVVRQGEALAAALGTSVYDALLNQFEPGGSSARIDGLFDQLAGFLPDYIQRALDLQASRPPVLPLDGSFPTETQQTLGIDMMRAVGFDFDRGRLDVSTHPFCGGAAGDTRITTRYREDAFAPAIMGVLHESGHAMYEQNLPAAWRHQPVGRARGMAIHESQSLIVEMQASRSPEFLSWLAVRAREAFGRSGPAWEAENFRRLYTRVERGFIRVDADELTYPAHVILRYRLERALVAGDLKLADLPGAWNDAMRELVGVVPPNDALGVLQDVHWPAGLFGYFPTYTLGAMGAAQLFDAATREDPEIRPALARGDFAPLMTWLRRNIHQKGSVASSEELMEAATGRKLDVGIFRRHLESRYLQA